QQQRPNDHRRRERENHHLRVPREVARDGASPAARPDPEGDDQGAFQDNRRAAAVTESGSNLSKLPPRHEDTKGARSRQLVDSLAWCSFVSLCLSGEPLFPSSLT